MTHRAARRRTALVTAMGVCAVTAVAAGATSVQAAPQAAGRDVAATVFFPNPVQHPATNGSPTGRTPTTPPSRRPTGR